MSIPPISHIVSSHFEFASPPQRGAERLKKDDELQRIFSRALSAPSLPLQVPQQTGISICDLLARCESSIRTLYVQLCHPTQLEIPANAYLAFLSAMKEILANERAIEEYIAHIKREYALLSDPLMIEQRRAACRDIATATNSSEQRLIQIALQHRPEDYKRQKEELQEELEFYGQLETEITYLQATIDWRFCRITFAEVRNEIDKLCALIDPDLNAEDLSELEEAAKLLKETEQCACDFKERARNQRKGLYGGGVVILTEQERHIDLLREVQLYNILNQIVGPFKERVNILQRAPTLTKWQRILKGAVVDRRMECKAYFESYYASVQKEWDEAEMEINLLGYLVHNRSWYMFKISLAFYANSWQSRFKWHAPLTSGIHMVTFSSSRIALAKLKQLISLQKGIFNKQLMELQKCIAEGDGKAQVYLFNSNLNDPESAPELFIISEQIPPTYRVQWQQKVGIAISIYKGNEAIVARIRDNSIPIPLLQMNS